MERPIAYMGDQPYIFVSYSHKDCERVWPIILKLQDEGFRIWYDDGISPGTEWDANIATHIRKCDFFAAFISRNYLESENCKDELSFVRELGKNRVLIYLEEVVLPDELQMRLGRLQAIYWNRDGEKKAYKKFMQSPGVNVCKEPVVPVEPPHEEPAAPPSVAEVPAQEPEKAVPVKTVAPAKSAAPAKASAPKKSPLPFVGIGVVVLVIVFLALRSWNPSPANNAVTSTQEVKAENTSKEDVPSDNNSEDTADADSDSAAVDSSSENAADSNNTSATVNSSSKNTSSSSTISGVLESNKKAYVANALSAYSNGVVSSPKGSLFSGILIAYKAYSSTFTIQQDLDYNGDTYTVSSLPFITISSYDDQNSIILGFIDKFGADFYFYGTYTVENGELYVSPGGSAGSFSQDCAPLTESLTYIINTETNSIILKELVGNTIVQLRGTVNEDGDLVLKGALSEGSSPCDGLQSLDLVLDIEKSILKKCVLTLEDGKKANVDSFSLFLNIHNVVLRWSSVDYILNGRPVTEDVNGHVDITYISQYPAGFLAIDSDRTIHYYQDLSDF